MPGLMLFPQAARMRVAGVIYVFDLNQRDPLAFPAPRGGNAISDAQAPRHPSLC